MTKSYTPLRPKRRARPPKWATLKDERVVELSALHTDDTEFGPGLMREDKDAGVIRFAYRRGGRWEEVTIPRDRLTLRAPAQGDLFGRQHTG